MGKDLHIRPKTMKLLEEIVETKLLNIRLSDTFFLMTPKGTYQVYGLQIN